MADVASDFRSRDLLKSLAQRGLELGGHALVHDTLRPTKDF
jgi:hypothetical protein